MNTPSPFTTACELLEQIIDANNLLTTVHRLETPGDSQMHDPGMRANFTPDPITLRQVETALLILTTETKKRQPNWDAACDMSNRALNLIELIRLEYAAAQRTTGANYG